MSEYNIPNDPVMLYSYLNTKLRDQYASFDALCEDMNLAKIKLPITAAFPMPAKRGL